MHLLYYLSDKGFQDKRKYVVEVNNSLPNKWSRLSAFLRRSGNAQRTVKYNMFPTPHILNNNH